MDFLWECMLLAWKGLIGYFLWIIAICIAGAIVVKVTDLIDRLFIRSLLNQMKNGKE